MVASLTERLAPDEHFLITNGTNITANVDILARDSYRVQVAAATTVLGGLIQVCKTNHHLILSDIATSPTTCLMIVFTGATWCGKVWICGDIFV